MSLATIDDLVTQRVADALANLEENRNVDSGGNGGESSHRDNRGPTRAYSY